ncbi:hypothetical protein GCM10010435_01220 [Winogradskya consettensis]|uniref:Endolytic murein transglycosylase n=2 Tax=Winogradskya TaxID=3240235 RepID=A0A919S6P7_9ACTN|nr:MULTISPECIES: endolytic transglycosylase MltG [Actinoplanes]GIE20762.1 hypothetical protein Ahu01nite_038640 [Actinoplanes humidus]GIM66399.1 hypothetical protein Aco04nite_01730 [Actinoplanes consettensis]
MIDELDLAFDEEADRSKPRHRRGAKGAKGGGKGKTAIAFLMVFVLLGVLGVGGYLGYEKVKGFFTAADYDGAGTDAVQVVIEEGSLTAIGNTLVDSDVVKSTAAFTEAAEANPLGKNIQAGTYNLKKQMAAKDAVTMLLDPKSRVKTGITITPGTTARDVYKLLAQKTGLPLKDFEDAGKDPKALGVPDFWFNRTDGKKASGTIEGFLYPDTYEFKPKATAAEMLAVMVQKFLTVTGDMDFVKSAEQGLSVSPYEALIVASLSQAEAGVAKDWPKVARVAYNRAYKDPKMPLQFDVTTNYWLNLNDKSGKHSGKMTKAELEDPKNPYTTELKVGLPLGPINNPSEGALAGAAKPASGPWLFFVAVDKAGNSAFATTNAEHEANIQKACRNGIPLC